VFDPEYHADSVKVTRKIAAAQIRAADMRRAAELDAASLEAFADRFNRRYAANYPFKTVKAGA
jgi:hypothetical protein